MSRFDRGNWLRGNRRCLCVFTPDLRQYVDLQVLTELRYYKHQGITGFFESTPDHELNAETESRCHRSVSFHRVLETFTDFLHLRVHCPCVVSHLLGDGRSQLFTSRFQINPARCWLNFLILGDDLVCIIALKLSLILFMNSERFSKMPSAGMNVSLIEVFAPSADIRLLLESTAVRRPNHL